VTSENTDMQPSSALRGDVYYQQISVPFDYPVHFARDVFAPAGPLLADVFGRLDEHRVHRVAVYVDAGLAKARPDLADRIKEYFHAHRKTLELVAGPTEMPGGEAAKNGFDPLRDMIWMAGNVHLDRQSYILAIGGGAMLDMVGFGASLVHRGLRLVRMPSTVLAQNDAGVGVKNSMDEHGQKNFLGTFAPPFAVVNDFDLLNSLAERDWLGGIAEAFKVAIIKDADFLDFLCDHASDLAARDIAAMETLIRRCAVLHLEHIRTSGDPFETGSARPLDFGHWVGHQLETMSDYWIGHGQGVAVGIAVDSYYAMSKGLISPADLERILTGMTRAGLPIYSEYLHRRDGQGELEILIGLERFREHLGGRMNITLPDGLGARLEVHRMDGDLIIEAVNALRDR